MANDMLTQLSSLINHQVDSHETLGTYLSKLDTLLQIALENDGFLAHPGAIPYYYLWVLSDIVGQAKVFNEDALNFLLSSRFSSRVH